MATASQVEANRANAQFSTGPSSPAGKLKSSHNAVKTGLTGRTILLPSDDVAAYEKFTAITYNKFEPATDEEKLLVQSIVDTEWRLLRIPTLESGLYALGRNELAAESPMNRIPKSAPQPSTRLSTALTEKTLATSRCRKTASIANSPNTARNSHNCSPTANCSQTCAAIKPCSPFKTPSSPNSLSTAPNLASNFQMSI
jgi:hypothetical protein